MRRSFAALLALVVLSVPSIARVYQHLDCRSTAATLSSSFSRSVDCPPSKIVVDTPHALAAAGVVAAPPSAIDRSWPILRVEPVRSANTRQPDSLRAPPAR